MNAMRNKRRISLGNPSTRSGAVYAVRTEEELFQMAVELEYLRLYEDGIPVTSLLNSRIQDRVRREQLLLQHKLSSLGIPENLKTLLKIESKSEVEKFCRTLQFTEFELFLLIHNCNQINFTHLSKFHEHIPNDRVITETDRDELRKGKFRSFTKKINSLMQFRKRSHVHFFESGTDWHCFFYSYNDIDLGDKSRWKYGSHLHYISHLWTYYDKDKVLSSFDTRRSNISHYTHIKFTPFEYTSSGRIEIPFTIFGWQPTLLAISADLPLNPNLNPIPSAQLATRGFWSGEISTIDQKQKADQ
jgi:hypothetical protein